MAEVEQPKEFKITERRAQQIKKYIDRREAEQMKLDALQQQIVVIGENIARLQGRMDGVIEVCAEDQDINYADVEGYSVDTDIRIVMLHYKKPDNVTPLPQKAEPKEESAHGTG
jgi:hypothetical protein